MTQVSSAEIRNCPDCGSTDVEVVYRGLTGPTDESDQFFTCGNCGRVTFEMVSRSARDVRMDKIERGRVIRAGGHNYLVSRVLKVGLDEFLIYVRPHTPSRDGSTSRNR